MGYSLIPWEDPCISFRKLWLSPYHFMSESQPSMLTNVCSAFDGVGNRWTKRSTTKFEKPCRCNAFTCQQQMQLPTQDLHSSSKFPSLLRFKNTCKNIRKLIKNSLQLAILNIFERSLPLTTWTPKPPVARLLDETPIHQSCQKQKPFRHQAAPWCCSVSISERWDAASAAGPLAHFVLSLICHKPPCHEFFPYHHPCRTSFFHPSTYFERGPHSLQTACLGFWNLRGVKLKEAAGEDATYIRHLRLCQDHLGSFKIFFHMFGTPQKLSKCRPLSGMGWTASPTSLAGNSVRKNSADDVPVVLMLWF